MKAYCLIRENPWYRREAFVSGLRAAGLEVILTRPGRANPGDVLVIWNRYNANHDVALRFERDGGTVLVAENGYINADGSSPKFSVHPKGPKPTDYYAIGMGFHNDSTRIPVGGPERWDSLGLKLKPWRADGKHILVCPNRTFGVKGRAMPADWAERAVKSLRGLTGRPVRVRDHPGNDNPRRPLIEDLRDCWAVMVWSSSCGVHALAEGIPAFVAAPFWIMKGASAFGSIDEPVMPERLPHFQRMVWGQWTVSEITQGLPFGHLLSGAGKEQVKVDL